MTIITKKKKNFQELLVKSQILRTIDKLYTQTHTHIYIHIFMYMYNIHSTIRNWHILELPKEIEIL